METFKCPPGSRFAGLGVHPCPSQQKQPPGGDAQRSPNGFSTSAATDDLSIKVGELVTPTLTQAARDLPPPQIEPTLDREVNPRMNFNVGKLDYNPPSGPDPLLAVQAAAPDRAPDGFNTPILNFNGQGYTFVNPPDTVGDIGKDHYIQMVNGGGTVVSIYNKSTGALIQSFGFTSFRRLHHRRWRPHCPL
ncbi:MAG: hypothetical protein M5U34_31875 [Chloroflexi bacterium]|nr:hypothetical protein [Chloroflexota bacterium]